ncbi:beta 1,4 glucosyltransferase [Bacteroidia bacterium]|nr:beta 1,4 glucosyltransferase [Bacteroidia bacterium]
MNPLSVVIITLNEAKRIEKCLLSIQDVADEIVVVDAFSTDQTQAICEKLGARFIQRKWTNFGDCKRFATQMATHDTILSLDADEVVSEELKLSIQHVKANWGEADAYHFKRLNFVGDKAIRYGAWYPDCKIRLFDRRKANWTDVPVHEVIGSTTKDCVVGHLQGNLLHYSFESAEALLNSPKTKLYTGMYRHKKKIAKPLVFLKAGFSFLKSYVFKLGLLDGKLGCTVARSGMKYTLLKYQNPQGFS